MRDYWLAAFMQSQENQRQKLEDEVVAKMWRVVDLPWEDVLHPQGYVLGDKPKYPALEQGMWNLIEAFGGLEQYKPTLVEEV